MSFKQLTAPENTLILASNSIRRAQLLDQIGIPFIVVPSDFDESSVPLCEPIEYVMTLALAKAESIECPSDGDYIVLGADTVVVVNQTILGKPSDEVEAKQFLGLLSGKIHDVYTGVSLLRPKDNKKSIFYVKTQVTMSELSELDIEYYISTKEPFDKAGAYGIQGVGARYIQKIEGDFYNVVGLPLNKVIEMLKEFNYKF